MRKTRLKKFSRRKRTKSHNLRSTEDIFIKQEQNSSDDSDFIKKEIDSDSDNSSYTTTSKTSKETSEVDLESTEEEFKFRKEKSINFVKSILGINIPDDKKSKNNEKGIEEKVVKVKIEETSDNEHDTRKRKRRRSTEEHVGHDTAAESDKIDSRLTVPRIFRLYNRNTGRREIFENWKANSGRRIMRSKSGKIVKIIDKSLRAKYRSEKKAWSEILSKDESSNMAKDTDELKSKEKKQDDIPLTKTIRLPYRKPWNNRVKAASTSLLANRKIAASAKNVRGLMYLRTMLKREMLAEGTYTNESALASRVQYEWNRLTSTEKEDLNKVSRKSLLSPISTTGSVVSKNHNNSTVKDSDGVEKDILDPLVPLMSNRYIFLRNKNKFAVLWDRIAAYQIVKSYTSRKSKEISTISAHSPSLSKRKFEVIDTQDSIDKLAKFANFPDDDSWLAAVKECQDSVGVSLNPTRKPDLAVDKRTESIVSVENIDRRIDDCVDVSNSRSIQELKNASLKIDVRSQRYLPKGNETPATQKEKALPLAQGNGKTKYSSAMFDDEVETDEYGEMDAYVSDDEEFRKILEGDELSESDEDEDRLRDIRKHRTEPLELQGSYPISHSTGQELSQAVKYRHIVQSSKEPGIYRVFIPLPSYRFVRSKQKRQSSKDDNADKGDHFTKRRNVEKLPDKFESVQEAALAYDACVRRLYNYTGYSYSTKTGSNQWQFAPDGVSGKKRSLRVFGNILQAVEEDYIEKAVKRDLPYEPPPKKFSKVKLKTMPALEEVSQTYHAYIANSLKKMENVEDLNRFSVWKRRNSLLSQSRRQSQERAIDLRDQCDETANI